MSDPTAPAGLFASLRQLAADALELAQLRLELLGNEVELEKKRLLGAVLRGALALMLLGLGLVLLCGFVLLLFGEGYRLAALGAMTVLFLGAGVWLLHAARQGLASPGGMLQASLAELRQDLDRLRAASQHGQN